MKARLIILGPFLISASNFGMDRLFGNSSPKENQQKPATETKKQEHAPTPAEAYRQVIFPSIPTVRSNPGTAQRESAVKEADLTSVKQKQEGVSATVPQEEAGWLTGWFVDKGVEPGKEKWNPTRGDGDVPDNTFRRLKDDKEFKAQNPESAKVCTHGFERYDRAGQRNMLARAVVEAAQDLSKNERPSTPNNPDRREERINQIEEFIKIKFELEQKASVRQTFETQEETTAAIVNQREKEMKRAASGFKKAMVRVRRLQSIEHALHNLTKVNASRPKDPYALTTTNNL